MRGREGGSQIEAGEPGGAAFTIRSSPGGSPVPHTLTAREGKATDSDATSGVILAHTLTAEGADASEDGTGRGTPIIATPAAVRRLTPRECERLQGFPDDWTAGQSDAARYRQLGNAIAVPVAEWITTRLAAADRQAATR